MSPHARFVPPHAYVPGRTARHPEGLFDDIRQTVPGGGDIDKLATCEAFLTGLAYLEMGFFWEAHELLEPVWMGLADESAERLFVQSLIQLANGKLKLEMGKPKAALRLARIATDLLQTAGSADLMGVSADWVQSQIGNVTESALKMRGPASD